MSVSTNGVSAWVGWILVATLAGCAGAGPQRLALPDGIMETAGQVDARGKVISTYVVYEAALGLRALAPGQVLELVTDDYAALRNDLQAWSRMRGQSLVAEDHGEGYRRFYLERGAWEPSGKSVAMIVSDDGLLELLSPLGFALAAALAGHDVHIYFQGPGVHVLQTGFTGRLRGFQAPFSGFARDGLHDAGHVSAQKKLAQLQELGATLYACQPSLDQFDVPRETLAFSEVVIAEYLTFMERLTASDIQLYPM